MIFRKSSAIALYSPIVAPHASRVLGQAACPGDPWLRGARKLPIFAAIPAT
jgi:hypothetical protein